MSHSEQDAFGRTALLLSVQRALLGAIGSEILGICVESNGSNVNILVYTEAKTSDKQCEELSQVETEVWADLGPTANVKVEVIENARQPLQTSGDWVFLRLGCRVK